jgi:hypothetical protein
MTTELTYFDQDGNTVYTAQFLKNRGTCCRSACMHCPYGFTLKKHRLQFQAAEEQHFALLEEILQQAGGSAVNWREYWPEHVHLILLKEKVCGFMLKNNLVLKHVFLLPHFQHQELSKELIESYYFI